MKFNIFKKAAKVARPFHKAAHVVGKHSPDILMGAGITSIAVGVGLTVWGTTKAKPEWEKMKAEINELTEQSEGKTKDELVNAYGHAALPHLVEIAKAYAPAAAAFAVGIGSILWGRGILKGRLATMTSVAVAATDELRKYRKRVKERHGEQEEFETMFVERVEKEDGGTKIRIPKEEPSQYARWFDDASPEWSKERDYNITFLKAQQNYANDKLHARGHLFLNEVYDMLGIRRSRAGAVVGWVLDGEGDGYVDFGIFREDQRMRDFLNQFEPFALLDFNVDGVIYDRI